MNGKKGWLVRQYLISILRREGKKMAGVGTGWCFFVLHRRFWGGDVPPTCGVAKFNKIVCNYALYEIILIYVLCGEHFVDSGL